MANKRFFRRKKKGRGEAKTTQTFIQSESARQDGAEGNSFFLPKEGMIQTKLKVSEPGDDQEREADTMADKVVKRKPEEEKVHKKQEDEKVHKKSEEEKIHKKQEDEKLHKKPEEEKVHKKPGAASGVAGSATAPGAVASHAVGKEGGSSLPASTLGEMSSSFGYDFGNVKIHTDRQAQEMSEQLGAQAFTYKGDIYFNKGKFDPGSKEGQWLLAHELTHVVQQRGENAPSLFKKDVPGISTPVPDTFTVVKKKEVILSATGQVKGVKVVVLPDTVGAVRPGKAADTHIDIPYHISSAKIKDGKIVTAGKADAHIQIQTIYVDANAHAGPSGTGRGTTKEDKAAGNTSVQFHEGTHGVSAIDFVAANPLPRFEGKDGMTEKAYNEAVKKYEKAVTDYKDALIKANIQAVHCVGTVDPDCKTP
jgi:hypothetical protein